MPTQASPAGATILEFPAHRWTSKRLTEQDRAAAWAWKESEARRGHSEVRFHHGPDGAEEDVLLACCKGELWTIRGVPSSSRRFGLWYGGSAKRLGAFASVRDALEAIPHCATLPMTDLTDAGWDRELFCT